MGRVSDTCAFYCTASKVDPGSTDAMTNLGEYLAELGETELAKASFTAAIRVGRDPKYQRRHKLARMLEDDYPGIDIAYHRSSISRVNLHFFV